MVFADCGDSGPSQIAYLAGGPLCETGTQPHSRAAGSGILSSAWRRCLSPSASESAPDGTIRWRQTLPQETKNGYFNPGTSQGLLRVQILLKEMINSRAASDPVAAQ